ncbi:hypothetical protein DAI22_01g031400 [Oryza sativa Japonica Group]|nr:hypothetical protein DAI22_01g031400 [Oryza sativa Japonica Group]
MEAASSPAWRLSAPLAVDADAELFYLEASGASPSRSHPFLSFFSVFLGDTSGEGWAIQVGPTCPLTLLCCGRRLRPWRSRDSRSRPCAGEVGCFAGVSASASTPD